MTVLGVRDDFADFYGRNGHGAMLGHLGRKGLKRGWHLGVEHKDRDALVLPHCYAIDRDEPWRCGDFPHDLFELGREGESGVDGEPDDDSVHGVPFLAVDVRELTRH